MMPYQAGFDLIRKTIKEAILQVGMFCVVADELPEPGKITDKLRREIWNATVCVCDLTGRNPNVVWELGYAQALGKPCICLARSPDDLFFDTKDETTIFYNPTEHQAIFNDITRALAACLRMIAVPAPEDLFGTIGHESFTRVLAASRVAETPYALLNLFKKARSHVFMAGQNHYRWVETTDRQRLFKEAVETFLRNDVSRRVDIMLCDNARKYQHAVRTWKYVCASRYARDLQLSIEFFGRLYEWANDEVSLRGRLTIKKVEFVPTSITFVDPEVESRALLVLTPNAYEEKSRSRPCYIISRKKNSEIFMSYWAAYSQRFHDIAGSNILKLDETTPTRRR